MPEIPGLKLAPNWTSAAGALEGILAHLGQPLPRHAIMGLTGHAWHFCLGTRAGVAALPSGPADLDWGPMVGRTNAPVRWERFAAEYSGGANPDRAARSPGHAHSTRAPPFGWDFHSRVAIVSAIRVRRRLLVHDILMSVGPFVHGCRPSGVGGQLFAGCAG